MNVQIDPKLYNLKNMPIFDTQYNEDETDINKIKKNIFKDVYKKEKTKKSNSNKKNKN
jgi:hypothetical protein